MKKNLLLSIGLLLIASGLRSQDKVFWGDQNVDKIYKANLDLTSSEPVADVQNPNGIAYFYSEPSFTIFYSIAFYVYHIKNDGSEASEIINTTATSQFNRGIAIDYQKKKIYWTNQVDGTIKRANLDGSGQEPILSGLTNPWDIDLDLVNQKIYWTEDESGGKINRANLDGTGATPLITNTRSYGVAVDPTKNKIYYTDPEKKKVFAATLSDGSGATAIYSTNLASPADIDIHFSTGRLYVTDYSANRIIAMSPSGTGITDLSARGTFLEVADMTAPAVTSIKRQSPAAESVDEGTDLTFRITFSEPVLNIDADDFSFTGMVNGDIAISHVSEYKVYDLVVSNINTTGVLNINVADDTDLIDFRGTGFSGTIGSAETFTIHEATTEPPPVTALESAADDTTPRLYNSTVPSTMVVETMSLAGAPGKLQIVDITGREQLDQEATLPKKQEFSTQNLAPGLYIVTLTANKKRFSWKMAIRN